MTKATAALSFKATFLAAASCFVSGHDFSRATSGQNGQGFSRSSRKNPARNSSRKSTGAKAQRCFIPVAARLKSCPDTKQEAAAKKVALNESAAVPFVLPTKRRDLPVSSIGSKSQHFPRKLDLKS
jgi:hypothetical protein